MHEGSLHSSLRTKRDTLSDEDIAKLKKVSTKKPTQLIKQKPTSAQLFKSSMSTSSPMTSSETTSSRSENNDSGHNSPISVPSSSASPFSSSLSASSSGEGNPFFAPEDVTLPPNSNSTVSDADSCLLFNRTTRSKYFKSGERVKNNPCKQNVIERKDREMRAGCPFLVFGLALVCTSFVILNPVSCPRDDRRTIINTTTRRSSLTPMTRRNTGSNQKNWRLHTKCSLILTVVRRRFS